MKEKCLIVRDLLPSYIEDLVCDETKQYIDNHISKCEECKQILDDMRMTNVEENKNTLEAEEAKIRLIKKLKKKKLILKIIGIILLVIFIIALIIFNIKFIPINSVRSKTYNKLQELKKLDNYKITVEEKYIVNSIGENRSATTIYYYKDGKYKEDQSSTYKDNKILYYSDENSNIVTLDKKTEIISTSDTASYIQKGEMLENLNYDIQLYSKNLLTKLGMAVVTELKEDTYDNKNYYVLSRSYDGLKSYDTFISEIWINKETMIVERILNKSKPAFLTNTNQTENFKDIEDVSEICISIEPNVVTDEDVAIPVN